jgi:hypothetical protein
MNEVIRNILSRRTIRRFTDKMVSDDIIDKLEEYDDHKKDLVPIFVNYIESYYCEEG